MANVVLVVLSMTIGFFFLLMGTLKLTPAVSEEVYREMRKMFIRSAKVFPFIVQTGWRPNPHMYRKVVGTVEVVGGLLMAVVPGPLKQVANLVLFFNMCGAVYTHYALNDGMDKMTPALIFGLLLGCRFIVYIQVKTREARQAKEKATAEQARKVLEKHQAKETDLHADEISDGEEKKTK